MDVIEFSDFTFTYQGSLEPTLAEINLKIGRKEFVIMAGATGSGKSTLLRAMVGLIPHMYHGMSKGNVTVLGQNVASTRISEIARHVGYVFQNPDNQIFMFSVEKDVALGLENLGLPREEIRIRVDRALDLLGIRHLADRSPHELSDGQKQRVALAGVLAMNPEILILDEPTARLDPITALEFVQLLVELCGKLNVTILIVEHRLELLAGAASRVVILNRGRIVADGKPRTILGDASIEKLGISIPASAKVHTLLSQGGVNLGETPLTPDELLQRLNYRLHD